MFKPHPLLSNAHVQTLLVNPFTRTDDVTFTRERLETPDDDFLDIDTPHVAGYALSEDAPIVLVIHGLEGDARRGYMCAAYRELAKQGIRSVGMNLRGCSGEPNRQPYSYHLGATGDVAFVHHWFEQRYPHVPKAIMGFSLGANLTLKYVGEQGDALKGRLVGAIAISPPFDLTGPSALTRFPNTIYARYLLRPLRQKASEKADQMRQFGANPEIGINATRLRDYDNAVVAPLNGFKDADDYYAKTSTKQFLPQIGIPTLIIRSTDDPFFNNDVPYEVIRANPLIDARITQHGGHCAFIEGWRPSTHVDWAQQTVAKWVKQRVG